MRKRVKELKVTQTKVIYIKPLRYRVFKLIIRTTLKCRPLIQKINFHHPFTQCHNQELILQGKQILVLVLCKINLGRTILEDIQITLVTSIISLLSVISIKEILFANVTSFLEQAPLQDAMAASMDFTNRVHLVSKTIYGAFLLQTLTNNLVT